jgi:hypothetical protein
MIALTANYRFRLSQVNPVLLLPLVLLALLLVPVAIVLAPALLLLCPRRTKNEIIERLKRGEITAYDAFRQLGAGK